MGLGESDRQLEGRRQQRTRKKKVKGKKRWHEEEARYADRREEGEQGEVGKGSANK